MFFDDFTDRAKEIFGFKTDKELSQLLGMKQNNFWNRKKKGTLFKVVAEKIVEIHPGVNFHWLVTGEGPMFHDTKIPHESSARFLNETGQYLDKAKSVIESGTHYADSLKANINSFYDAIEDRELFRKEIAALKNEIAELRGENKVG